ncbi:hypothetical protein ACIBP6_26725 [Nonomuraea terrae]|uniref:hypothetical protein n=1 Tax=Nonomuraea terrae TaxID=2530383 RepID=UPI003796580D
MDVTVPPEVDAVLELMGVPWPNVSVDEILADRDAWATVLAGAGASGAGAQAAVGATTGAAYHGVAATELAGLWGDPGGVGQLLGQAASAVRYVPALLDNAAWLTTAVKYAVAGGAVWTSAMIARAMLVGGPTAGALALRELIRGRILVTGVQREGAEGVGRVLRPALAAGSTGKFRNVLDDLPRLGTGRGPMGRGPGGAADGGPRGMSIAQMGLFRKNSPGKTNSGTRHFDTPDEAVEAAKKDAKDGGRSRFRGPCSSDDHVHVDYINKHGEISHTRHYPWKKKKD